MMLVVWKVVLLVVWMVGYSVELKAVMMVVNLAGSLVVELAEKSAV